MELFESGLPLGTILVLLGALLLACAFEFVNGFHDTANAVATVIYTHSLRPWHAVVWSGLCNFAGVFVGGIAVALSIIYLLPLELLVDGGSGAGLAMVFALLLAAILWNAGTWYFGLPSSSSHTLIGAILGVGVANGLVTDASIADSVHWGKAGEIGLSLLISPLVGFGVTAMLLFVARKLIKNPALYQPPPPGQPPPMWIRALLIVTCTGVSFAHGSNDGQKGVGLIMLILIGLVPASYALDPTATAARLEAARAATFDMQRRLGNLGPKASEGAKALVADAQRQLSAVATALHGRDSLKTLDIEARQRVRRAVLVLEETRKKLQSEAGKNFTRADTDEIRRESIALRSLSEYAPTWVLFLVALSLGVGTMVGWRRIVVTVGEKIGKSHLTYAQGAAAELVAMSTIGMSAVIGAPVSTTHVLSSGIAGAMAAQGAGVQMTTVRKIGLAWLMTLPASMVLSGVLFLVLRFILT